MGAPTDAGGKALQRRYDDLLAECGRCSCALELHGVELATRQPREDGAISGAFLEGYRKQATQVALVELLPPIQQLAEHLFEPLGARSWVEMGGVLDEKAWKASGAPHRVREQRSDERIDLTDIAAHEAELAYDFMKHEARRHLGADERPYVDEHRAWSESRAEPAEQVRFTRTGGPEHREARRSQRGRSRPGNLADISHRRLDRVARGRVERRQVDEIGAPGIRVHRFEKPSRHRSPPGQSRLAHERRVPCGPGGQSRRSCSLSRPSPLSGRSSSSSRRLASSKRECVVSTSMSGASRRTTFGTNESPSLSSRVASMAANRCPSRSSLDAGAAFGADPMPRVDAPRWGGFVDGTLSRSACRSLRRSVACDVGLARG